MVEFATNSDLRERSIIPTYTTISKKLRKLGLYCDLRYCTKLHGSWLHQYGGIPSEVVDFLQGRVSTSVFSRHYLTPDASLKDKVIDAVTKLQKEIESQPLNRAKSYRKLEVQGIGLKMTEDL
jgi:intergrase/recombinase